MQAEKLFKDLIQRQLSKGAYFEKTFSLYFELYLNKAQIHLQECKF